MTTTHTTAPAYNWEASWGGAWSQHTGTEQQVMEQIEAEARYAYPDMAHCTHLVDVYLIANEGQDDENTGGWTLQLDPEEPACDHEDGHDWQDGQPYGSDNGGIHYTDTCTRCPLERYVDTNHETSAHPGKIFRFVSYAQAEPPIENWDE